MRELFLGTELFLRIVAFLTSTVAVVVGATGPLTMTLLLKDYKDKDKVVAVSWAGTKLRDKIDGKKFTMILKVLLSALAIKVIIGVFL